MRTFNGVYEEEYLNHVAFPLGGMGAGMVCLEGTGGLSHVSLRHCPEIFFEPELFAAICIKGVGEGNANLARVVEGPVQMRRIFGRNGACCGLGDHPYGLPRFAKAQFLAHMPFGEVSLTDAKLPISVKVTGWSPFVPGDADASSLPVAGLEYQFTNNGDDCVECVFSYHARNPLIVNSKEAAKPEIRRMDRGFVLRQPGRKNAEYEEGSFAVAVENCEASVDAAWFRGGWFDARTMVWTHVQNGDVINNEPHIEGGCGAGASVYAPIKLEPHKSKLVRILLAWHVPHSQLRTGLEAPEVRDAPASEKPKYEPWYAGRFSDVARVMDYWRNEYAKLRSKSQAFSDALYESTLPDEVIEAVAANLTILKSPTVLRDKQGRFWGWEGCGDTSGSCAGSCTHVWNYAQALPHLFSSMEQTLRETEFNECQNSDGKQGFRAPLPIRPIANFDAYAAADGQLGGIIKAYREWRISGDNAWLRRLWPAVKSSMKYCIETWDPTQEGVLKEPHHNTYDIEFWGADGMCSSFYLGALKAAMKMGTAVGDDVSLFEKLYHNGRKYIEQELFNGEYFYQRVQWKGLQTDPSQFMPLCHADGNTSDESHALELTEGPKYQYGTGCLSDGVLGAWMALVCGVGEILDHEKVKSHLLAVYQHNLKHDLSEHVNPQRSGYALNHEGGLLLCSWPRGNKPALPFVYSDEVWTGIEYQVAAHLMSMGCINEGLEIVRTIRTRYDGRHRNPFNEYEYGHWYARAMSSFAMLEALCGARYDAVTKTMTIAPQIAGDFKVFFSAANGFGMVGVKENQPFVDVRHGTIDVQQINYEAPL